MYHSVTFGDKNTYDDWRLVPSSRPLFVPPPVKTNYIDLPGSNGKLDLTEVLNGYPVYENRVGSMEFIVLNGYVSWDSRYAQISNYLHGKRMKAVLEDDPYWYYEGRFSVNEWRSEKDWSRIVIDYDVYPFKRELYDSSEPWLWDPFNLENGVVRDYSDITIGNTEGGTIVDLQGSEEPVIPVIIVNSSDGLGMEIGYNGVTYHLNDGENRNVGIIISPGASKMIIMGKGKITIKYRGGSL